MTTQILYISEYNNQNTFNRRNNAWPGKDRKNGTIYINHENINNLMPNMNINIQSHYNLIKIKHRS